MRYVEIGKRIRDYRVDKGLSQEGLLEELRVRGVPMGRNTLSGMENGREESFRSASLVQLGELCDILGCSIGHLLGEYDCRDYRAQVVREETGLSEGAISELRDLTTKEKTFPGELQTYLISMLIEGKGREEVLRLIGEYISIQRKDEIVTYIETGVNVYSGGLLSSHDNLVKSLMGITIFEEIASMVDRYSHDYLPVDLLSFRTEELALQSLDSCHDISAQEKTLTMRSLRGLWNDPDAENPFIES